MIHFETETVPNTGIRFGRLILDGGQKYNFPALAPVPIKSYDMDMIRQLMSTGAKFPILIAPLRYRHVVRNLTRTALLTDDGMILGGPKFGAGLLIFADIESEIFSYNNTAREEYQKLGGIPKGISETLFHSGLTDIKRKPPENSLREYTGAWEEFRASYKLTFLRNYVAKMQSELGSPIFFAPTPLIRVGNGSLKKAFNYGREMLLSFQGYPFQGLGIHLLIDSQLFGQENDAEDHRFRLTKNIANLGTHPEQKFTNFPFVSMKVYDPRGLLLHGSQASIYRKNLSSTIVEISENVRSINGLLIIHNFGTWGLGAIDSGADLTGFRTDGKPFTIDNFFHRRESKRERKTNDIKHRKNPVPQTRNSVNPFDFESLSDGDLKEYKSMWKNSKTFPHPPHVRAEPWWERKRDEGIRYRTRTIVDSLMELDREIREMPSSGIPIADSIVSRINRMKEQDPMFDLCPSVRYKLSRR